jgi:uncharacterized membrane protein YcaP (DUF421 family)
VDGTLMETVLRAAVIYFFLLVVIRAMGRKELSGMSSFELLLIVIMGDLIQQGVTQQDTSLTAAMLAVGTLAVLVTAASYVSFRWSKSQPVLEGLPVVILRDGKLMREALKIERLSEDEVKEAARQQGIGDLADVTVGVMEADGSFSFVTRSGWQHPPGGAPTG